VLAETLLSRHDIDGVLRGRAESVLGDLALLAGDVDGARLRYDAAAKYPSDESASRLLTVKRAVCSWPAGPSRAALVPILISPPALRDAAVDLATLQKLADRDRDLALYHYLLARQLFARGRFAETVEELGYPAAEKLPDFRFDREAARLSGIALYRLGRLAGARAQFQRLAGDHDANVGTRLDAFDWLERCDFAQATGK
jgi:tetratricopeptide (TPR) repeat protein